MADAFQVEVDVAVPPDEAWAFIGDPGAVPRWYPAYTSCVIEGVTRTLTRADGAVLVERLVDRDEEGRVYSYSVTSGLPLASHLASFQVLPTEGGSRIVWRTEARHEDPSVDMEERLAARQREALLNVKRILEG